MKRTTGGIILTVVGVTGVLLVITNKMLLLVQARMRYPLLIASAVLIAVGLISSFMTEEQHQHHGEDEGADHSHSHGGLTRGFAWLLLVPTLVMVTIKPAPLGAQRSHFGTSARTARSGPVSTTSASAPTATVVPVATSVVVPVTTLNATSVAPVPTSAPAPLRLRELTLNSFTNAVFFENEADVNGVTMRLRGFVTRDPNVADGLVLTRYQIFCCAADGILHRVILHGAPAAMAADQWIQVEGFGRVNRIDGNDRATLPEIDVTSVTPIAEPTNPYE